MRMPTPVHITDLSEIECSVKNTEANKKLKARFIAKIQSMELIEEQLFDLFRMQSKITCQKDLDAKNNKFWR